jgi:hypothetical protein
LPEKIKKGSVIAYYMENQAWEKALVIAASEKAGLTVVGIQHSTVPLLAMSHFNHPDELGDGNWLKYVPRPAYLACVGSAMIRLFGKSGWEKERLFILGGLRYKYISQYLEQGISWGSKVNRIVVALSIIPEESLEILWYVYHALKGLKNCEVLIKPHYALDWPKFLSKARYILDDPCFTVTKAPISDLLPSSKILIVAGSTVAIEGVACQNVVIVPRLTKVVDMNPLTGITELVEYVNTPDQLRKRATEILAGADYAVMSDRYHKFVSDYFEPADSDGIYWERFLKGVEGRSERSYA